MTPPRRFLLPLAPFYRLALAARTLRLRWGLEPVRRLRFPVISIGNLSTGGAGKTPLAIALAHSLTLRGVHVDVLSRGYGRTSQWPARVRLDGTAEEFGDEPLLIAREAQVPVYVARQRYEAGKLAEASLEIGEESQPIAHILDDGFQHRQLHRDVDLLLLNGQDWRDSLLPAGNLREPLGALTRADVLAIPANESDLESELRAWGWKGPIWRLVRCMEVPNVAGPVIAFCGIARPEQFFRGLQAAGISPAAQIAFPDHHRYTSRDLQRILASGHAANATALVTTDKDLVRLGPLSETVAGHLPLKTARLRVEIDKQAECIDWLVDRLRQAQANPAL